MSRSKYAALIFGWWKQNKFAAVSRADAHLRPAILKKVNDELSREANERNDQFTAEKMRRRAEKGPESAMEPNKGPFPLAVPNVERASVSGNGSNALGI